MLCEHIGHVGEICEAAAGHISRHRREGFLNKDDLEARC
jgi:hypothetical protein